MSRSRSLTAKPVVLERYEIEALIEWHCDQQFKCAHEEDYTSAGDHKHRVDDLKEELK